MRGSNTPLPHLPTLRTIFTNLRDQREVLAGVESTRSQVIFRENLP